MLFISKHDIKQCIDMPKAIELMAAAFSELSVGEGIVPVRHILENNNTKTTGLFMPASLPENGSMGIKIVGVNENNLAKGIPFIHDCQILNLRSRLR